MGYIYSGMSDEERSQLRHAARQSKDQIGFCIKEEHRNRDGQLVGPPGQWNHNSIMNLGYKSIWDVYFKGTTVPANQLLALVNAITGYDLETVVGDVTFVTGTSYADITMAYGDWTNAGSPMVATAAQKTFTAGGTWTAAIGSAILTPTRAIFICYDAFAASRTLYNGDTLKVTATLTREAATE